MVFSGKEQCGTAAVFLCGRFGNNIATPDAELLRTAPRETPRSPRTLFAPRLTDLPPSSSSSSSSIEQQQQAAAAASSSSSIMIRRRKEQRLQRFFEG